MGTKPRRSRASANDALERMADPFAIRTEEQLGAHIGPVAPASVRKETTSRNRDWGSCSSSARASQSIGIGARRRSFV
jgi:hypothetical protein